MINTFVRQLLLFIFLLGYSAVWAADYYWVNNGGNWSDFSNHWQDNQGGFYSSAPSDTDQVFFDANSFNTNGQTVTIDVAVAKALSIDFTGVTNTPTIQGNVGDTIAVYGSLHFAAAMANAFQGVFDFRGSNSDSIFSNGVNFPGSIKYSGFGTLNQGDALTTDGKLFVQSGTFRTNSEDLTIGGLSSDNGNTRSFLASQSIVYVTGSGEVWGINNFNFTISVDSCFIILSHGTNAEMVFNTGGNLIDYNSLTLDAPNIYFPESGEFGQLTINPGVNVKFLSGGIFNVTNIFAAGSCDEQIRLQSDLSGTQAFLNQSAGTVTGDYLKLKDINSGGGATFNALNSIDEGNVTGWNITSPAGPAELYWIGGTGNWNDGTHWSTTSGGASAGCIPGPNTNVFFDASSFLASGDSVIIDYNAYCNNMDWSAATLNPVLAGTFDYKIEINGSLDMIAAMTAPFAGQLNFVNTGTKTITTNNLELNAGVYFADNGTWDIQSDFTSTTFISLTEGNLNTNGNALEIAAFYSSSANTRAFDMSNSVVEITGDSLAWDILNLSFTGTFTGSRIRLTHNQLSPVTFTGGGLNYNELMLITRFTEMNGDNIFALVSIDPGNTLTLAPNSLVTVDSLSATGNCNEMITIETLTALAPTATLLKNGFDSLLVDYCIINNVEADTTGGKYYFADNSTLLYNTTGWSADTLASGNTYYWIGGTGNWDDANHWSLTSGGAPATCIPGIKDTVIFDFNSGSPVTVTVRQDAFCAFMDWTTVTGTPELALYRNLYMSQGALLNPSMQVNAGNSNNAFSSKLTFISDSTNVYFNPAGVTINTYVYYDAAQLSDTLFLMNDLEMDTNYTAIVMLSGTFQTNGNGIKTGRFILESTTDKLALIENSYIDLAAGWDASNANGSLTVSAAGSTIEVQGRQAPSFFHGDGADYHNLILNQEVNDTLFLTGSNDFNKVRISAGVLLAVQSGSIQTATDSIIAVGTCYDSITMIPTNPGSFFSLVQVNSDFKGECLNIKDCNAAGASLFQTLFSTNLGGNVGWNFLTDRTSEPEFTFPSFDVCPGETVALTNNTTSYDGNLNSLNFSWDFDDGDTSQQFQPTHTYTSGGVFNIVLSSTFTNGCTETYTDSVRVNTLSLNLGTTSPTTICEGDEVTVYISDQATDYQFSINSNIVQPFAADTFYTTTILADGDSIKGEYTYNGCTFEASPVLVFNVKPAPNVTLNSSDPDNIICDGEAVTFNATGADNYQFYVDNGTFGFFGPDSLATISTLTDGQTVSVEGRTDSSGCLAFSDSTYTFTVFPNPVVTLVTSAIPQIICDNELVTFTATGATSYEYYVNGQLVYGPTPDDTYNTDSLSNGDEVYVIGSTNDCPTQSNSFTFIVNPNPSLTLTNSSINNEICEGTQVTFSVNGATAYQFFIDGNAATTFSANNIFSTTTLSDGEIVTVVGETNSCQTTSEGDTMTVFAKPAVTFSMNSPDSIICLNEEVIFSASGAAQYEWLVNSNPVAGPSSVDTFAYTGILDGDKVSVRAYSANGCTAISDTTFTYSVLPIPNVNLYSSDFDSIIQRCESVTFTAIGADSFQFFIDGIAQGSMSVVDSFVTSTLNDGETVSVIGRNSECPAPGNQEFPMTVNPLPALSLVSSVPNDTVCFGEGVNLSVSGVATNFEYFINGVSQGVSANSNITVTQLQDGDEIYAAGYTNACPEYTDTLVFTVLPLPIVSVTSSAVPNNTICGGDEVIVRANGAQLYEFFVSGVSVGAPSAVDTFATTTLSNNQTITVKGYSLGCVANADTTFTYNVTSIPNVNFYSSSPTNIICEGEAINFTALGSPEYEFFIDGISQGPLSPTNTFNHTFTTADTFLITVTATNNNCSASSRDSFDVVVKPLPDMVFNSSDLDHTICDGDSVAFIASGADQYRFLIDNIAQGPFSADSVFSTQQLQNGQSIRVRGLLNGCTALSDSVYTYSVNPIPTITLFSSVTGNILCEGDTLSFTANGANEYEFFVNGNSVQGPSSDNMFEADTFTTGAQISVIGTSLGCSSAEVLSNNTVTVNPNPVVSFSTSDPDSTICDGDLVTLSATGAAIYEFFADGVSLGAPSIDPDLQVNSIQNGQVVTAVGSFPSGCATEAPETYTFTVHQYPTVGLQASVTDEICIGDQVDFTASGANTYTFLVNGNPVLGPGVTSNYSTDSLVNGQSVEVIGELNGCAITSDSVYNYNVYIYPVVTLQSSDNRDSICLGSDIVFTASGAASYQYYLNGTPQTPPTQVDTFAINTLQTGDVILLEGINNICRSTAADSFSYTVVDYPNATMTGSHGGSSICFGDTLTFTTSGAEYYRFYVNEIPQGQMSANNTIELSGLEDGDWVRVEAANYDCAVFSADSFQIDVNKMPLTFQSSLPTNIACAGESVVFTASGADQYEFFVDGVSQGAASATNTITLNNLQEGQIVNVRGTSFGTGCNMFSEFPFQVAVLDEPIISVLGSSTICDRDTVVLQSNSPINNQWYLDGVLIPDANQQELSVFEAGDYTLETYQGGNGNFASVGGNNVGQLGNGNFVNSRIPYTASEPDSLIQIDAGLEFNLALRSDGNVYSWGGNDFGQLGNSNFADKNEAREVGVLFPSLKIAAGYKHALAIYSTGQVLAWGKNTHGQLGTGNTTTSNFPLPVDTFTNIIDIAAGENHSMYLRSDGSVWAWGDNTFGQLGDGTFNDRLTPTQVLGLSANITAIACGANHSLALAADSTLWIWGNNSEGQLGRANIAFSETPLMANLREIVQIDGGAVHTLALRVDGRIYTWGGNNLGQMGIGLTGGNYTSPQRIGLKGVKYIEAGPYSSFAIKQDKSVWGWGLNATGQLGDSTLTNRDEPVFLSRFSGALELAAGENHTALIYGFNKACQSAPLTITVETSPEAEITNTWPSLTANSGASYQWYIDGLPIPNATGQELSSLVDGEYTVEVTYANGCSESSEGYQYVTGIDDIDFNNLLSIAPNPNEGQFSLILQKGNHGVPESVELLDLNGKQIAQFSANAWNASNVLRIDAGNQASGLYFVKILMNNQLHIEKVLINK